ncbi:MAG: hypothetical protein A2653_02530 [Candidatus Zambryskibacteria bacterium RIFCSPHIGHO2_01_FULL_43_25]|uniref:EamA domain-containing protein n=1 Tax=Candidatus Zambryskibacteria bacterium RIFCSPLOWO2_01_FULL_45_21 TaxID=1802761 RepID=A0A1G2U4W1_9BACT|nr:MAG: hypothetical protein A2653_02530 [Candidatus Zambryskibacteria bacterium RIFCSPHIGHO2_01_FULL_43_25]OHB01073.1 MAG: hypothetical protein A3E94_02710 [Candidatus Zambryskibacteria bacterium RIFCSPHIGHO2_12_FULL_44_12b]OHB03882.1 MAG: hypothetical protein A3B14_00920 [Candidatus Zambryskibacteria bacterium RIFCSPLOWO2_01_FULL_45_21]
MNWFFIAILAPILYSAGNYVDKIILNKHFKGSGVGTIVIFSCFLGALTIPIIFFIEPAVFAIPTIKTFIMMLNGGLTVLAVIFYLYAIDEDEISVVVPILQMTPVFGFFISFFLLGETLTFFQIIGSAIIIIGATIISIDISYDGNLGFKKRMLTLASASAFVFALNGTIFKYFALDFGYWQTEFWEYVGIAIVGFLIFIFVKQYRYNFVSAIKNNRYSIIGLNFLAEIIMVSGDLIVNFATLLAPVALVYVVNSFQPVFVYIYGLLFTLFLPKIIKESVSKKQLIQKTLTICMMVVGSVLLYANF